jgi:hypothetical protein
MEDKRQKLNMAVDGATLFLQQAASGEPPAFAANLFFCVLAKYLGEMQPDAFRDLIQAASVACSAEGCDCMRIRRDLFKVLARLRADYQFTVHLKQPRCRRFKALPEQGGN